MTLMVPILRPQAVDCLQTEQSLCALVKIRLQSSQDRIRLKQVPEPSERGQALHRKRHDD